MACKTNRRRKLGECGDTLVELAFVLVPLVVLLFGILDFGFAIFLKSTFQHAVREGVRYAITYETAPGLGHDDSVRQVVQRNTMNLLSPEQAANKVKIRYFNPALYNPANPGDWTGTLVTGTGSNAPGNIVEVSIEDFQWHLFVPAFFSSPLTITVRASDKMEGLPGGAAPPPR